MAYTRIKICGIMRTSDAVAAAEAGADAIGLNFFAGPRRIPLDLGRQIVAELPPLTTPVALTSGPSKRFPDAPTFDQIRKGTTVITPTLARPGISTFQFYGDDLSSMKLREPCHIWSVCHVEDQNLGGAIYKHLQTLSFTPAALVIDAAVSGQLGGTGKSVNWTTVAAELLWLRENHPHLVLILAGGLTPENVADAIRTTRPYAVDVSSGVEVPNQPGAKDPMKICDFIQAARSA